MKSLLRWLSIRRECAWCAPRPWRILSRRQMRWIGGNPFARTVTHGMCPGCLEKMKFAAVDNFLALETAKAFGYSSVEGQEAAIRPLKNKLQKVVDNFPTFLIL